MIQTTYTAICDRCGFTEIANGSWRTVTLNGISAVFSVEIPIPAMSPEFIPATYDLCPQCSDLFEKFMRGRDNEQ